MQQSFAGQPKLFVWVTHPDLLL